MHLQSSHHVTGRDTVDPNVIWCPLHRKRRCQLPDSCLGRVIRSLGLRHIDNSTGHASNHDNATAGLALDQVPGNPSREVIGTVDVDGPAFLHPLGGVVDGVEVLRETGGGDKVVDMAVLGNDLVDGCVDGVGATNVGVVSGDLRGSVINSSC